MVHVWSINSGERFQGHHGPLVMAVLSKGFFHRATETLDHVVKG